MIIINSKMTTATLRKEVLNVFKKLHRTRLNVFAGDEKALKFVRDGINLEFKKNKVLSEDCAIQEQIQLAKAVEVEIRTTVVQAREVKPGVYEARLNSETLRLDNVPFNDCGYTVPQKASNNK